MNKTVAALLVLALTPAAFALDMSPLIWIKEQEHAKKNAVPAAQIKSVVQKNTRGKTAKKASAGPGVACELFENGQWVLHAEADCLKDKAAAVEVYYLKKVFNDLADGAPTAWQTKYSGIVNIAQAMRSETFCVNHSIGEATRKYMGFGPEDDLQYDYKHSDYYPGGSIKINLTERGFETVKFYYEYILPKYGAASPAAKGWFEFLGQMLYHESLHGYQFRKEPVTDFKRIPEESFKAQLADRKIDDDVFNGSLKIVQYEEDAIILTNHILAGMRDDFAVTVNEFKNVWAGDKNLMSRYPLLDGDFYGYYMENFLRECNNAASLAAAGKKDEGFGQLTKYSYLIQSEPLKVFREMVEINDGIKAGKISCSSVKTEVERKKDVVFDLMVPDYKRDPSNPDDKNIINTVNKIKRSVPRLVDIQTAVMNEFETFNNLCK